MTNSKRPRRVAAPAAGPVGAAVVRDAIAHVSPDVERGTWARVAMAIKSELGDAGFELFDEWSAKGESYKQADARATWRSVKGGGKTTIGTLFALAKANGFRFPRGDASAVQTSAPAAAEAAERRRRRELEAAQYRDRADKAGRVAAELWGRGKEAAASPYLQRKGVRAYGVRVLVDGTTLVPMRNAAGELLNVQRIAPARPADGSSDKRYLPGGRKSGLFHVLGEPPDAPALLLAEGLATASTLFEATGRPTVVAFDAGNLVHVAKALREIYPRATLIVCSDDDRSTEARTGRNPGRAGAATAARAVATGAGAAGVAFPECQGDESDFNDMAARAGVEAVRSIVEAAIAAPAIPKARRGAKAGPGEAIDEPDDADDQPAPKTRAGSENDPFKLDDLGVWHTARDAEGNAKKPAWLCTPLQVAARTRADDGNGWGCLLQFGDPDGNPKSWAMPSALLSGEGAEWAGRLRDMGLKMAPGARARNLLAQYIDTRDPEERVTCTDRVGWHAPGVYVLPSSTITASAPPAAERRFVFQSDAGMEDTFRRNGSLREWQRQICALAVGNSRMLFGVSCAFAGPVLRLSGLESGGFHFRSISGAGKTSVLLMAASVWGRPSYMQRWRATSNFLESTAAQHSDGLLILDEIAQLDAREAGQTAYLLSNEQEKGRANRMGLARKRRTWKLIFLSSGEISLADHMAEVGQRLRAGMEVRMADIPLDAGAGMGGIETLHDHAGPAAMVEAVVAAARCQYGTAGRAWIEWLCDHYADAQAQLLELVERYRAELPPEASAEQVRRVAARFALVAAAGELATKAGITGWPPGEAARGVRHCFNAWLSARGHLENGEAAAMVRQVRQSLERDGESRYTWWHRAADDHAPKTMNRAGFRRLLDGEGKPIKNDSDHVREYGDRMSLADMERAQVDFIVLREVFRREICAGFDPDAVANELKRRGHLIGEGDRLTDRQRLPGVTGHKKVPCYRIKSSIFEDEL